MANVKSRVRNLEIMESGDVQTVSGTPPISSTGGTDPIISLDDAGVTFAKMQAVSANILLGNDATGTTVEEIPCTPFARTILDDVDGAAVRTTIGAGAGTVTAVTGTAPIASTGGATPAISLNDDGVTYAKIQNVSAASRLLGRGSAAGAGDPEEIVLGTNLAMSGTTLNATGGVTSVTGLAPISSTGGTTPVIALNNGGVTLGKMADLAANSIIGNNTGIAATPLALTAAQVKTLLAITTTDVSGLGTIATQNANAVTITGGSGFFADNGLGVYDSGSSGFKMTVQNLETLTADRRFRIVLGDATRTLTMAGDATISGTHSGTSSNNNTGDQTSIVGITGTTAQFNTALTDDNFATLVGVATLTNKRVTQRVLSISSNPTEPTINTDLYDVVRIFNQSSAITSFTTNLSGTPVDGDELRISVQGTVAIALTFGSSFENSTNVPLSTTTSTTKRLDMLFYWNANTSKWRQVMES